MSRFPFPIPTGWFPVARSGDVGPGEGRPVRYFAQDLVVWRSERGVPAVLDAYCAHLGAHLGVGKGPLETPEPGPPIITGECIQCQFHGWRYDASGACVDIPYSTAPIPAQARVRGWDVLEVNGLIFAWHHIHGAPPAWTLPAIPEFDDPAWVPPVYSDRIIASCLQEVGENDVDFAHFQFVHGTDSVPEGVEVVDGTYKSVKSPGLERETFGLGLGVVRVPTMLTFVSSVTPVDEDNVHVRWLFTVPAEAGEKSARFFANHFSSGVTQDIPIWENKIYRPRPVLTKSEAGIIAHRNWSKQFYSDDLA